MFESNEPIFESHMVLKASALQEGVGYAKKTMELQFRGYANGIIDGVEISVEDDDLTISPGRIYYNEHVYLLTQSVKVKLNHENNQPCMVKVRFAEPQIADGLLKRTSDIVVAYDEELRGNELEICSFTLQKGARLRNEYKNFRDYGTHYNTINLIDVPHSAFHSVGLSPQVMNQFGKELYLKNVENIYDLNMATECLKQQTLGKEYVVLYIHQKLGVEIKDYSNREIYQYLCKILDGIKERRHGVERRPEYGRIMIE